MSRPRFLNIPESDVEPLVHFARLTDSQARGLFVALRDFPLTLRRDEIVEGVIARTELPRAEVAGIVRVLLTLYALRAAHGLSSDELADLLVSAAERSDTPELKLDEAASGRFRNQIRDFLSLDQSVGVISKAIDVAIQHDKLLHQARIITDIRPVFPAQVSAGPAAMVVAHVLKLEVHRGSGEEAEEIFVSLNSTDLGKLADVVRRAQQKEDALRVALATSPIPLLTVRDE